MTKRWRRGVVRTDFLAGANATGATMRAPRCSGPRGRNAGFTGRHPWIEVNPNMAEINVEADRADRRGRLRALPPADPAGGARSRW